MIKLRVRPAQEKPVPPKKPIRKWILWGGASIVLVLVLFTLVVAIAISRLDITLLEEPRPTPSYIYDSNGDPVTRFSPSSIDPVPLEQLPDHVAQAIVAVEDKRFYEHRGVDIISISRALWRDLKARQIVEGGSTITQQLAKNLFLSSDRSLMRKLKEAGYAIKIDMHYDKNQVLELYLNHIYYGEGTWGIQNASQLYFNKDAGELTLEEAALLAGLPKAPTHYSPWRDEDKALARRNLVLSLMKDQQYITEAEYEEASSKPSGVVTAHSADKSNGYSSYANYVIDEAITKYGLTENDILTGGVQIYTGMDPVVQQAIDEVYAEEQNFPAGKEDQIVQSGAVLIDSSTGIIRGMAGQRGEAVYRGFNRATHLKRQPGSAIKPLVVYAPALEKGYTPRSILFDGELELDGYRPQNWDRRHRGEVTLEEAVIQSWNVPAVWLLNEMGLDVGLSYANKFGLGLSEEDRTLGLALGGINDGVSPLQMAQAFSTFPNLGVMNEGHAILKITTAEGDIIAEAEPEVTQVLAPEQAYTMTLLLQEAVQSGTGGAAKLSRPAAGKTGTTQLPDLPEFADITGQAVKDGWFVGYTPEITAAIWVGYDYTDRDHYLDTGSSLPAGLFSQIMNKALQNAPVRPFEKPPHYDEFLKEQAKKEKEEQRQREKEEKKKKEEEKKRQKEEKKQERERKKQELKNKIDEMLKDRRKTDD